MNTEKGSEGGWVWGLRAYNFVKKYVCVCCLYVTNKTVNLTKIYISIKILLFTTFRTQFYLSYLSFISILNSSGKQPLTTMITSSQRPEIIFPTYEDIKNISTTAPT